MKDKKTTERDDKAVVEGAATALADRMLLPLLVAGALLASLGFVLAFTTAPLVVGAEADVPALIGGQMVTHKLLLSQKIFFFHVPVAVVSFIGLFVMALYGLRFLRQRDQIYDLKAMVAAEIALLFIVMTMLSGELWERFEWGVWWTWEPRLTTYLILMLLVIAYFILRAGIDDPERRAVFASAFGAIAFVDGLISLAVTRLIPAGAHPVVFRTDSGLPPAMLVPFILTLLGMLLVAFGLYRFRLRERRLHQQLDELKASYENQKGMH
ncbi:MAG: cytochrome c biogenesis protein [Actinomycetia bacterium]|nr:cytochrome c biogenesis protein [Actinomycetes bacterium]